MSSGGTSSVVHTDFVDNIICVYRGQKHFVLVDPSLYAEKVCWSFPNSFALCHHSSLELFSISNVELCTGCIGDTRRLSKTDAHDICCLSGIRCK